MAKCKSRFDDRKTRLGSADLSEMNEHQFAYFCCLIDVASTLARLFPPVEARKVPAFHASRSPGAFKSQSGRISSVRAPKSCQRSLIDGRAPKPVAVVDAVNHAARLSTSVCGIIGLFSGSVDSWIFHLLNCLPPAFPPFLCVSKVCPK
jgi:hypothetical protein